MMVSLSFCPAQQGPRRPELRSAIQTARKRLTAQPNQVGGAEVVAGPAMAATHADFVQTSVIWDQGHGHGPFKEILSVVLRSHEGQKLRERTDAKPQAGSLHAGLSIGLGFRV